MKWNDYPNEHLFLYNKKDNVLYQLSEGSGSNILWEDIMNGYKDYWVSSIYDLNKNTEIDGGFWLEKENIFDIDYTIEEVINRMMECDLYGKRKDWEIADNEWAENIVETILEEEYKDMLNLRKETTI